MAQLHRVVATDNGIYHPLLPGGHSRRRRRFDSHKNLSAPRDVLYRASSLLCSLICYIQINREITLSLVLSTITSHPPVMDQIKKIRSKFSKK